MKIGEKVKYDRRKNKNEIKIREKEKQRECKQINLGSQMESQPQNS